jgi:photosystem II stability/assembly factor-like uncharacterized protein
MRKNLLLTVLIIFASISLKAQWEKTSGPPGCQSERIVNLEDTLFVSVMYNGVYRSKDNGLSWEDVSNGLPNLSIADLYTYNTDLYAAIESKGIYKSEDFGENWIPVNSGVTDKNFYRVIVEENEIYASCEEGVYYSDNDGQDWNKKDKGIYNDVIYSFNSFDTLMFAGGDSLYLTKDKGENWESQKISGVNSKIMSIVSNDSVMFLFSEGKVLRSLDTAQTWTQVLSTGAANGRLYINNDTIFITGWSQIHFSLDNGSSWVTKPMTTTYSIHDVIKSKDKIIITTMDGVFNSADNGNTWNSSNNGLAFLEINTMVSNSNYLFAGTYGQGVFRSNDNGETWEDINNGLTSLHSYFIHQMVTIDDDIVVATDRGVFKTSNDGDLWSELFDPGVNSNIYNLAEDEGELAIFVWTKGIYTSSDTGQIWIQKASNNLDLSKYYTKMVMQGDTLLIGSGEKEVFVSTDKGETFTSKEISSVSLNLFDLDYVNDTIFASTSDNLYYSFDLGENWYTFSVGLTSTYIYAFYETNNKYFVSTLYGPVFIYIKDQQKWFPFDDYYGEIPILDFVYSKGNLFAGTQSSSVWRRETLNVIPEITGYNQISTPEETELEIQVSSLIVNDPDNQFPNDFDITVNNGDNYTLSDNKITPVVDYNGTLKVPVFVYDGTHNSEIFVIDVSVTSVNDTAVIISSDTLTVSENHSVDISLEDLMVTDVDNIYPVDFSIAVYDGDNYSFNNNTITPNQDFIGFLSVPVTVNDGFVDSKKHNVVIEVILSTGMENIEKDGYKVFPNPTSQNVNISFTNDVIGLVVVNLIDITGKIVLQKNYTKSDNLFEDQLDIKIVKSGIYFIEIKQLDEIGTIKRIIKN